MPVVSLLECSDCQFKTENYNMMWRQHLLAESHQTVARDKIKFLQTAAEKKTSVVVFGLQSCKMTDVMKYFGDISLVTNFIFWKERPDFCIVTFLTSKFRNHIVLGKHTILMKKITVRARHEISDAEWFSICPFSAPVKMEVNREENNDGFFVSSDDEDNNSMSTVDMPLLPAPNANNTNTEDSNSIREKEKESITKNTMEDADDDVFVSSHLPDSPKSVKAMVTHMPYRFVPDLGDDKKPSLEDIPQANERPSTPGPDLPRMRTIDEMMEEFYNHNLMPPEHWNFRLHAINNIQNCIREKYPACVLIPYGAGSTAISSGRETLSLYADIWGVTCNHQNDGNNGSNQMDLPRHSADEFIKHLTKILYGESCKWRVKNVNVRNSEIRFDFFDRGSSVECKLQVAHFLAVQCCSVINFLCTLDARVRPLLIIMRHWGYYHYLVKSNPGPNLSMTCFRSSSMQWLPIYFLMVKKILPSLQDLQKAAVTRIFHGNTEMSFCNDMTALGWTKNTDYEINPVTKNPSAKYMLTLAQEMFEYFGGRKIGNLIFSPSCGSDIKKRYLAKKNYDQTFFENPLDWRLTQTFSESSRPFTLQHPFKLLINMTFKVSYPIAKNFQAESRHTAELLKRFLNDTVQLPSPVDAISYNASCNLIELQPEPIVPDAEPRAKTAVDPPLPLPRNKIKNFKMRLNLPKNLEDKVGTSIKRDTLVKLWFASFEEFNSKVWPLCFGIKVADLTSDSAINAVSMADPWKMLGTPCFGVIADANSFNGRLNWALANFDEKCKEFRQHLVDFRALLIDTSKRGWARVCNAMEIVSNSNPGDSEKNTFSFECHTFCHVTESSAAEIEVHFNKILFNVVNSKKDAPKIFKSTFFKMYKELWEEFFLKRVLPKILQGSHRRQLTIGP